MLLNKYELKEKHIISLKKKSRELYKQKRYKDWYPVKPYQDGWIVYISLRSDIARRDDVYELFQIIDLCGKTYVTKNAKRISLIRKIKDLSNCEKLFYKKGYNNSVQYEGPHLKSIKLEDYNKLPDNLKKYFYRIDDYYRHNGVLKLKSKYAINIPKYYFVLKVKPRIITHHSDINPEVIKEEAWIDDKLDQLNAWAGGYKRSYDKGSNRTETRVKIRKFIKGETEDINIEKIRYDYR